MPLWGDSNALVTVTLFGDLDCPHTRRAITALALEERFGCDLRVAFRHRPVPSHRSRARPASWRPPCMPSEETRPSGAWLSSSRGVPSPASPARFEAWARRVGEDPSRVAAWAASASASERVDRRFRAGRSLRHPQDSHLLRQRGATGGVPARSGVVARHRAWPGAGTRGRGRRWRAPGLDARLTARNFIGIGNAERERSCPSLEQSPVRGPADAPVTLVFFGDFAC